MEFVHIHPAALQRQRERVEREKVCMHVCEHVRLCMFVYTPLRRCFEQHKNIKTKRKSGCRHSISGIMLLNIVREKQLRSCYDGILMVHCLYVCMYICNGTVNKNLCRMTITNIIWLWISYKVSLLYKTFAFFFFTIITHTTNTFMLVRICGEKQNF